MEFDFVSDIFIIYMYINGVQKILNWNFFCKMFKKKEKNKTKKKIILV